MNNFDEYRLIEDIRNGKYPLVKFIDKPLDVFISGNLKSDEVKIRSIETVGRFGDSLTQLVYNNPNSKIFIYCKDTNPYWFYEADLYDPYKFELRRKGSKYLRVAILPLTQSEVEYELANGLTNHLDKQRYKLLLIA